MWKQTHPTLKLNPFTESEYISSQKDSDASELDENNSSLSSDDEGMPMEFFFFDYII